jgi:hypothetical protein
MLVFIELDFALGGLRGCDVAYAEDEPVRLLRQEELLDRLKSL